MKRMKSLLALVFLTFILVPAMIGRVAIANFTPVLPSDNIIIGADGRVTGTNKIVRDGDTYTFVGNVSGTKTMQGGSLGNVSCALAVYRSNIVIDGKGFTLQCNNLTGIDISNGVCQKPSEREVWNVTIRNLRITNFTQGIRCEFGGNHTIYGNYISNDYVNQNGTGNFLWDNLGVAFWGSVGNNITHCTVGGSPAIYMHFTCSNNVVTGNNIVFGAHLAISGPETFDRNYWSDYALRYPNASEVDSSGEWSTPYAVDSQRQDNHPLRFSQDIPNFHKVLPVLESVQESSSIPVLPIATAIFAASVVAVAAVIYHKRHLKPTNPITTNRADESS